MDHHNFEGRDIPHIKLNSNMTIEDLVDVYASTGFNGRQLGEAAKLFAKMIENDTTICLTMAGAMTPVGFGGIVKTLIEKGFIDWIITTGANVYHEDHFAWGLPVKQGHYDVDDNVLYEKEIVRIRDIFVKYYETLEIQDQEIDEDNSTGNIQFTVSDIDTDLEFINQDYLITEKYHGLHYYLAFITWNNK